MNQAATKKAVASDFVTEYLQGGHSDKRLQVLRNMRRADQTLNLPLVDDLLCVELPEAEKRFLLRVADSSDATYFEDFLTRSLLFWDQNLAANALHTWRRSTDQKLWGRLLHVLDQDNIPQRIYYILLDYAWYAGGKFFLQSAVTVPSVEEFSEKTVALLFHRLVQWNLYDPEIMHLAEKMAVKTLETPFPTGSALPFAMEYLARFKPEQLTNLLNNPAGHKAWGDVVKSFSMNRASFDLICEQLEKFLDQAPEDPMAFYLEFFALWPPCWLRFRLPETLVQKALLAVLSRPLPQELPTPPGPALNWEFFAGVPEDCLVDILLKVTDPEPLVKACQILGSLLPIPFAGPLAEHIVGCGKEAGRDLWQEIPGRLHFQWGKPSKAKPKVIKSPKEMKAAFLKKCGLKDPYVAIDPTVDDPKRQAFFDLAYRGRTGSDEPLGDNPWTILSHGLRQPDKADRGQVCRTGLTLNGVFIQALFRTLEQFEGCDDVVPALSNYMNTTEESELAPLLRALDGVNTVQANSYLVRFLGKSQVSNGLKLEISQMLAGKDLAYQQPDLRELVKELSGKSLTFTTQEYQLLDSIRSLLLSDTAEPEMGATGGEGRGATLTKSALDQKVAEMVPESERLPRESLRSLRTAVLILHTIKERKSIEGVDISPAVDMQYKALEILFRSLFEDSTLKLVQSGILQRKLDVLGYARPVKAAMDEFENHISSLPIIQDIPIFSKFKLNKILRAIALYRPGRRFTLDGLKAFGLFFLVFGRNQCRYRLERLYETKFTDDSEMMAFCRDLHVFQDIRNRAVHEGLPVQAMNDVEALWNLTASLIKRGYQLR